MYVDICGNKIELILSRMNIFTKKYLNIYDLPNIPYTLHRTTQMIEQLGWNIL